MASDFDKDDLEVKRYYTRTRFTLFIARLLLKYDLKHHTSLSYRFSYWLVGFANLLRSASPRDGFEWVDRRTSLFSKLHPEQQSELIARSLKK